jgi:hypothetical protein
VLWGIVAVAAIGILLGLRYRVPTLLAATAVTAVASAFLAESHGFPTVLLLVITLQCAYLLGLSCALVWRRITAGR